MNTERVLEATIDVILIVFLAALIVVMLAMVAVGVAEIWRAIFT